MRPWMVFALTISALGCGSPAEPDLTVAAARPRPLNQGAGGGTAQAPQVFARSNAGITYNGGSVMLGTPDVYYIWYGDWSNNTATTILPAFMSSVGGSPYFAINTTYSDASGRHVSGQIRYAGSTTDGYSRGTTLTSADIPLIVESALSAGRLPVSANAIYFVLTSSDVTLPGFCSQYCGYHTYTTLFGTDIKYSFVGNPDQCPSICAPYSPSPNGNQGADGMASIVAHELEETVTDPNLDGWGDTQGENGDKCAWKYGPTYQTASGAYANQRLGGRDYLIQENFNAATGKCAQKLDGAPPPPPLTVEVLSPGDGGSLQPGGPLDITASVQGSSVSSATVNWTSPGGTATFAMTLGTDGNWTLATTMSASARPGARRFTVTATDAQGHRATSPSIGLMVQ